MSMRVFTVILLILVTTSTSVMAIGEAEDNVPIGESIIIDGDTVTFDAINEIRTYLGRFESDDDEILVEVVDVDAGDTIYAYAAGIGLVNTYIYVLDEAMLEVFVEDDDGAGGYNSVLSYQANEAGSYVIGMITTGGTGTFRLVVGVNTPEILSVSRQAVVEDFTVDFEPFDCDDAEFGDRPNLSGRVRTLEEDAFVIHYTQSGSDSTSDEWIEELADALQLSLDVQLDELGWALPPADCGEGGDERLDVYVMDLEDIFAIGVATPENLVGDNPNTEVVEYYAAYSFLRIDNDLSYLDDRDLAIELMRTTAAHEVHHNIQFGYDVNDRFFGIYEAGSTWIETLVYPESTNAGSGVHFLFSTPDSCLGSFAGRGSGDLRVYSEWVVIDSFTRDLGIGSYQFIWEYMAANEGLEGFYRALAELDTTPQDVMLRTAVRNLLLDYDLGIYFDTTVRIEAEIDDTGLLTPNRNGVQQLGVDYIRITELDTYTFEFRDGDDLEIYIVGIDADNKTADLYNLGDSGTVDLTEYDFAYAIILNTRQHSDIDVCEYTSWILQVSDGTNEDLARPTGEIWDASNFVVAE